MVVNRKVKHKGSEDKKKKISLCTTNTQTCKIAGPYQSMKVDDRKINRSIDGNRLRLVNWYRLASANR